MRILWVPQISSKSINGELLLNTDSNMSFFLNLMQSEFGRCNDVYVAFEYKIPDKFKGMIFASGVKGIFEMMKENLQMLILNVLDLILNILRK